MERVRNLTLYHKFAATMIFLGLIPIQDYKDALEMQYEQAAFYVGSSIETMLNTYDTISQMPYNYNYGNEFMMRKFQAYDNLRQILHGEKYHSDDWEDERGIEMETFLQYVAGADEYLVAVHFAGVDAQKEPLDFHYSNYSTYFK